MLQTNDGINWPEYVNAAYYVAIVLVGNFFMLNLVLGVLAGLVTYDIILPKLFARINHVLLPGSSVVRVLEALSRGRGFDSRWS